MNWLKENWFRAGILLLVVIVLYWFGWRPATIKGNCSRFTETIKADAGVTKEQATLNKKAFNECSTDWPYSVECFRLGQDSKERPAQAEKKVTREASGDEYTSCLRRHGL